MSKNSKKAVESYLKNKQQSNLGSYSALASQYTDAVREPSAVDAIGGAYSQSGSGPANGPAQRETNALLSGLGAGFSGAANEERRAKLSPIEQQTQQLLEMDAMMKASMYEEEAENQQVKQFFKRSSASIAQLSKASMSGDTVAANNIAKGILQNARSAFQDPTIGDFDHYNNGTIYYINTETGQPEGRNISQLIYQSGIDPVELFGQDAPMIEAGLSPGAKMNYENSMQAQQYQLQNMNLQNQKLSSDIDYNRFRSQPQAQAPEAAPIDENADFTQLLNNAENKIKQYGSKASRGNFERFIADKVPGGYTMSQAESEINALGELIKGKGFNAFGYKNQAEFEHVPSISINNTPEANLAIIEQYKSLFGQNSGSNQGSVVMTNTATGEQFDVPQDKVELFRQNGYQ